MFRAVMVGLAVMAGSAFVLAPSVTQNKVGVSISNTLTTAKDGRVLRSSLTPKPSWRGPYTFVVAVGDTVRSQVTQSALGVVDTVWDAYPSCTRYRMTVYPTAVLDSAGVPTTRRDSLFRSIKLCRSYTATELAFADTFPALVLRDSMGRQQNHNLRVGESFILCALSRNRYTGEAVVILSTTASAEEQDKTALACEHARAVFEAERSS